MCAGFMRCTNTYICPEDVWYANQFRYLHNSYVLLILVFVLDRLDSDSTFSSGSQSVRWALSKNRIDASNHKLQSNERGESRNFSDFLFFVFVVSASMHWLFNYANIRHAVRRKACRICHRHRCHRWRCHQSTGPCRAGRYTLTQSQTQSQMSRFEYRPFRFHFWHHLHFGAALLPFAGKIQMRWRNDYYFILIRADFPMSFVRCFYSIQKWANFECEEVGEEEEKEVFLPIRFRSNDFASSKWKSSEGKKTAIYFIFEMKMCRKFA